MMNFSIMNNVFGCDKNRLECLWRENMLTYHLYTNNLKFKYTRIPNHNVEV